jgi:hypothetical protein
MSREGVLGPRVRAGRALGRPPWFGLLERKREEITPEVFHARR